MAISVTPLSRPAISDNLLGGLDVGEFLREYWQQKPLLVRQAFSNFADPLSPDELAGLACEEDIDSRIVRGCHALKDWQLEHGPFPEDHYASLGEENWTLLVQSVDHYLPEVAEIKEHFRFIPDWRLDDIMVSFAATGGSVGPHYDNYDVFLIQGQGRREWQVGDYCPATVKPWPHPSLRLLESLEAQDCWVLEPGDMLYLPPRFAHWGVALDNCMTYSVGFRAPSDRELIESFCDTALSRDGEDRFYTDGSLDPSRSPAEIPPDAVARFKQLLLDQMDDDTISRWLGEHLTRQHATESEVISGAVNWEAPLVLEASARCAWMEGSETLSLFINGEQFEGSGEPWTSLVHTLCDARYLPLEDYPQWQSDQACQKAITRLHKNQWLVPDDEY